MARIRTFWVVVGLSAVLLAGNASADLAPNPVEEGDVYFSAGLAIYSYHTSDFGVGSLYINDNVSGAGVTTTYPQGFLLNYRTSNDRVVTPEIQVGYAFKQAPFKGALGSKARLHFAFWGNQRDGSDVIGAQAIAPTLRILMQPVDGADTLLNGDPATWFHSFALHNNWMTYEQKFGTGDMMIFFDEPKGPWRFTRGAGLTAGYDGSNWMWQTNSPQMESYAVGMSPASWSYGFDLSTFYVGPRAAFSMGWEPFRQLSVYVSGSFAPMLAVTNVNGLELGQCLGSCNISNASSAGTVAWSTLSSTDVNFAYDARMELGASIYLWVLRLSAQGGVFANNQFTTPQETNGEGYEANLASQWGYFARAMATLSF